MCVANESTRTGTNVSSRSLTDSDANILAFVQRFMDKDRHPNDALEPKQMARLAGVHPRTARAWRSGTQRVSRKRAEAIANCDNAPDPLREALREELSPVPASTRPLPVKYRDVDGDGVDYGPVDVHLIQVNCVRSKAALVAEAAYRRSDGLVDETDKAHLAPMLADSECWDRSFKVAVGV